MRVLLISPLGGVVGGIAMWTKHIVNYMATLSDVNISLCDFSRKIAGQTISSPIKKWLSAAYDYICLTHAAIHKVKDFDGDVVHICTSASFLLIKDILILQTAKKKGLRTCIHFHFGRIPQLANKRGWEWKLLLKVISIADTAIVMDKMSFSTLEDNGYQNVVLIPNPISEEVRQIVEDTISKRVDRLLLFAGHCIPTKRVFELVRACKTIPNIRLRMIGAISDNVHKELTEIAGNQNEWLEIKGQVSFKETIIEMKSCDIFVLPTYTEGFPNVILESMACGCPIIASSVGAIPEMLEEEDGRHYGILIVPQNESNLKTAILTLLGNDKLKVECGNNARKRVYARYNIQTISNQLIKTWQN